MVHTLNVEYPLADYIRSKRKMKEFYKLKKFSVTGHISGIKLDQKPFYKGCPQCLARFPDQ